VSANPKAEILKKLTDEQRRKLKEAGIAILFAVDCKLCGAEIKGASDIELRKNLDEHLAKQCPIAQYLRKFKPNTQMRTIGHYLKLSEKIRKGKATQREMKAFVELGERILIPKLETPPPSTEKSKTEEST